MKSDSQPEFALDELMLSPPRPFSRLQIHSQLQPSSGRTVARHQHYPLSRPHPRPFSGRGRNTGQRLYFGVRIYCLGSTLEGHPGRAHHSVDSEVQLMYVIFEPSTCGEDNLSDWVSTPLQGRSRSAILFLPANQRGRRRLAWIANRCVCRLANSIVRNPTMIGQEPNRL
jgi:hypothetical protein